MKRLSMRKIRDVLRLSAEGMSTRQIASSLAIGRSTLQGYLDRARDAEVVWPLPPAMSDTDLERLIFPRTARDVSNLVTQPDWADIHRELRRKGVTLRANKSETIEWLKFTLEGVGERTYGYAFEDTAF